MVPQIVGDHHLGFRATGCWNTMETNIENEMEILSALNGVCTPRFILGV